MGQITRATAAKALDLPYDEMQIDARKSVRGIGPLALIGATAIAGLPGILVALALLLRQPTPGQGPPAVEKQVWRAKFRWGMKDGKPFEELRDESGKVIEESP